MKKILALILALAMLLTMASCTKRPENTTEPNEPDKAVDTLPENDPENTPAQSLENENTEPEEKPEETPAQPEPVEEPEESPEPSEEPVESPEPSEETKEDEKIGNGTTVASTATDLIPADSSFLSLIPELPFENWASTTLDASSVMLELRGVGGDAQSALMEYIQDLRDEGFTVTEYIYGSLYEAENDKAIVTIMLEGGTFTVTIEKK